MKNETECDMKQLELKKYTRQEIADALNLNKSSSNFKRDVENKLSKWGYDYIYTRAAVTITKRPESADERLKELLIRELHLDK